jgi:predicted nucleic acid-binding protein
MLKKYSNYLKEYVGKSLVLEPEERYVDKAFDTATEHGITIHDALYIAVALQIKLPLPALDKRQGEVASKTWSSCKALDPLGGLRRPKRQHQLAYT